MKRSLKSLLLGVVIVAIWSVNAFAAQSGTDPPSELTKFLREPGQVLEVYDLQWDYDLQHIIVVQHGPFVAFTYARLKDNVWDFNSNDVLEILIFINQKPQILWSRDPP